MECLSHAKGLMLVQLTSWLLQKDSVCSFSAAIEARSLKLDEDSWYMAVEKFLFFTRFKLQLWEYKKSLMHSISCKAYLQPKCEWWRDTP